MLRKLMTGEHMIPIHKNVAMRLLIKPVTKEERDSTTKLRITRFDPNKA
jgi:hypothetical protein